MPRTLEPLVELRSGGATALVCAPHAETLGKALLHGQGLQPLAARGRGAVFACPLAEGEAIVRECRRGGAMRHLLADSYVNENRPLHEFELHRALYGEGLPLPEPLGVRWTRNGAIYRGAVATRKVDAPDLRHALRDAPDPHAQLRACGAAVRALHDAGVWHADLNIANILMGNAGPILLDLDKARRVAQLGTTARARNLLRFRRSLEKHGFDTAYFRAFLEGYGAIAIPAWLDAAYRLKGALSMSKQAGAPG